MYSPMAKKGTSLGFCNFPRSVLFCQPHQQLSTHSPVETSWGTMTALQFCLRSIYTFGYIVLLLSLLFFSAFVQCLFLPCAATRCWRLCGETTTPWLWSCRTVWTSLSATQRNPRRFLSLPIWWAEVVVAATIAPISKRVCACVVRVLCVGYIIHIWSAFDYLLQTFVKERAKHFFSVHVWKVMGSRKWSFIHLNWIFLKQFSVIFGMLFPRLST